MNYICPVEGAKEAMEKIDPSLVDNELIFPGEETLAKAKDFMGAGPEARSRTTSSSSPR